MENDKFKIVLSDALVGAGGKSLGLNGAETPKIGQLMFLLG